MNTNGPSFFPWLVQQICVPVVVFFCLIADPISRAFSPGELHGPRLAENIWATIVAWGVGFLLAVIAAQFVPRFAEDGGFIWILPSVFLIMGICSELPRKGVVRVLSGLFYPDNVGEENLLFVLVTIPAYSCFAYSLGTVFVPAILRRLGKTGKNPAS